jgi:hypothetical protein
VRPREKAILEWTELLSIIERDRLLAGWEQIRRWNIEPLDVHLRRWDMDTLIASTLLREDVARLVAQGVEETRLLGKLRRDHDLWPTWAEIRAAGILLGSPGSRSLAFEPDRSRGRHSDFLFHSDQFPEGVAIEFKAMGLSDEESRFCQAWAAQITRIRPSHGLMTFHAPIEVEPRPFAQQELRHMERETERAADGLAPELRRLAGATVAVGGAESSYVARLRPRFRAALEQLPDEECLVAFLWTNGAPSEVVREALGGIDVPANLRGILLIGSVMFVPAPSIHNYVLYLPTPFETPMAGTNTVSAVDNELADLILRETERASGVRATILRAPSKGRKKFDLVMRNGAQRIYPYSIHLDKEPRWDKPHGRIPIHGHAVLERNQAPPVYQGRSGRFGLGGGSPV